MMGVSNDIYSWCHDKLSHSIFGWDFLISMQFGEMCYGKILGWQICDFGEIQGLCMYFGYLIPT